MTATVGRTAALAAESATSGANEIRDRERSRSSDTGRHSSVAIVPNGAFLDERPKDLHHEERLPSGMMVQEREQLRPISWRERGLEPLLELVAREARQVTHETARCETTAGPLECFAAHLSARIVRQMRQMLGPDCPNQKLSMSTKRSPPTDIVEHDDQKPIARGGAHVFRDLPSSMYLLPTREPGRCGRTRRGRGRGAAARATCAQGGACATDGRETLPGGVGRLDVGLAPAPDDERARTKSNLGLELLQERRFADARFAGNAHDGGPTRFRVVEQPDELPQLGHATNEALDREWQVSAFGSASRRDGDSIASLPLDLVEGAIRRGEQRVRIDAILGRRRDPDRDARRKPLIAVAHLKGMSAHGSAVARPPHARAADGVFGARHQLVPSHNEPRDQSYKVLPQQIRDLHESRDRPQVTVVSFTT